MSDMSNYSMRLIEAALVLRDTYRALEPHNDFDNPLEVHVSDACTDMLNALQKAKPVRCNVRKLGGTWAEALVSPHCLYSAIILDGTCWAYFDSDNVLCFHKNGDVYEIGLIHKSKYKLNIRAGEIVFQ